MQLLLTTILALSGLHQAIATPGGARVTQAPVPVPALFRRQDSICPPGDYTVCPDGFGCCENGAPCTTIRGEPACDTDTCVGSPCGDSGLCCDAICSSSLGTGICVHTGLATDDYLTDYDDYTTTTYSSYDLTESVTATATSDDNEQTATSTPAETTEDLPTIVTPTASSAAEPTQTSRSGDDSSSSDSQPQSGDDGTDGAGMVSAKGAYSVLGVALIFGGLMLR
ncbi:hypothetical protein BDW69DRAFT_159986 [Aspergillus filifer]